METLIAALPDGVAPAVAVALVATAWLTAAITAAFGLGGGVVLLAVLVTVVPPTVAIPVHAVLQAGANAGRTWFLRREVLLDLLRWFLPGSVVGVALGSLVVVDLPVRWLSLALAAFILWTVWGPKPGRRALPAPAFVLVGAASSFATLFVGATGPLVAAFLPPERHGRLATVATHGALMSVQHLLKIVAFGLLGFAFADWLVLMALMLSSGLVGTWSGTRVLRRLPERLFRFGFRALLTLLAAKLLLDAARVG